MICICIVSPWQLGKQLLLRDAVTPGSLLPANTKQTRQIYEFDTGRHQAFQLKSDEIL